MTIQTWSAARWISAGIGTAVAGLVVGVPTGIISTHFYQRMTPVLWWNYPVWVATSVLSGLILATYVRSRTQPSSPDSGTTGGLIGSTLSFLAIGCPVCNKVIVAALGVSGALNIWAPVQPALGALSVGLLVWALSRRLRNERSCALPPVQNDPALRVDQEPPRPTS
jgi:hypothetical protein